MGIALTGPTTVSTHADLEHGGRHSRNAAMASDGTLWLAYFLKPSGDAKVRLAYSQDAGESWQENTSLEIEVGTSEPVQVSITTPVVWIDSDDSLHVLTHIDNTATAATNEEIHYFFARDISPATSSWTIANHVVESDLSANSAQKIDLTAHLSGTDTYVHIALAIDTGSVYTAYYERRKITSGNTITTDQSRIEAGVGSDDSAQAIQIAFLPDGDDPRVPATDPDIIIGQGGSDGDNTIACHLNATSGSTWATSFSAEVTIHTLPAYYPLFIPDGNGLIFWMYADEKNDNLYCEVTNDSSSFTTQNTYSTAVDNSPNFTGGFITDGTVYIVWSDEKSPQDTLQYRSVINGTGFGTAVTLLDSWSDDTNLVISPINRGFVLVELDGSTPAVKTYLVLDNVKPTVTWVSAANRVAHPGDAITFDWSHSDGDSDPQAAYELRFSDMEALVYKWWNGSALVTTRATVSTATEKVTIPADTFTGPVKYAVKTSDSFVWSDWSPTQELNVTPALARGWGMIPAGALPKTADFSEFARPTAVGTFVKPTSTGTQSITGLGFTPAAIIVLGVGTKTDNELHTEATEGHWMIGMSSGPTESFCVANDVEGTNRASSCRTALIAGLDATHSLDYEADLDSFDSDGFTLDWTTAGGGDEVFAFFAIGGVDAYVSRDAIPSADGEQEITGAGFSPNLAFFVMGGGSTVDTVDEDDDVNMSFGYATEMSSSGGKSNWYLEGSQTDLVTDMNAVAGRHHQSTNNSKDFEAALRVFTDDGVQLDWGSGPGGQHSLISLMIGGVSGAERNLDAPNTAAPDTATETLWFPPRAVVGLLKGVGPSQPDFAASCKSWIGFKDLFGQDLSTFIEPANPGEGYHIHDWFAEFERASSAYFRVGLTYNGEAIDVEWDDYEQEGSTGSFEIEALVLGDRPFPFASLDDFTFQEDKASLHANPVGMQIRDDYLMEAYASRVRTPSLSGADFALSTGGAGDDDFSADSTDATDYWCSWDGRYYFMLAKTEQSVYRWDYSAQGSRIWFPQSAGTSDQSFDVSSKVTNPYSLFLNMSGDYLFVGGDDDKIHRWDLGSHYDMTGPAPSFVHSSATLNGTVHGIHISGDGRHMLTVEGASTIYYYKMTTPWDLTTLVEVSSRDFSSRDNTIRGVSASPDGRHLLFCGQQNDKLYRYEL